VIGSRSGGSYWYTATRAVWELLGVELGMCLGGGEVDEDEASWKDSATIRFR
jgi:hypothetical protein